MAVPGEIGLIERVLDVSRRLGIAKHQCAPDGEGARDYECRAGKLVLEHGGEDGAHQDAGARSRPNVPEDLASGFGDVLHVGVGRAEAIEPLKLLGRP